MKVPNFFLGSFFLNWFKLFLFDPYMCLDEKILIFCSKSSFIYGMQLTVMFHSKLRAVFLANYLATCLPLQLLKKVC